MKKRNCNEIEKDLSKIQKASETATSFSKVSEMVGLSIFQVRNTLSNHPAVFNKIKQQLKSNRLKFHQQEQETLEKIKPQEIIESSKDKVAVLPKFFVLDASIVGYKDVNALLSECCESGLIILTSITIYELHKLLYNDTLSAKVRYILTLAAKESSRFLPVMINENFKTADQSIIEYCRKESQKRQVFLLTSDKEMASIATCLGIQVKHVAQNSYTLLPELQTKLINDKLLISQQVGEYIIIYSNGIEYPSINTALNINDDVLIGKRKGDEILMIHYRIINLHSTNNFMLVYSLSLKTSNCSNNRLKRLPTMYRAFLKECRYRFDA